MTALRMLERRPRLGFALSGASFFLAEAGLLFCLMHVWGSPDARSGVVRDVVFSLVASSLITFAVILGWRREAISVGLQDMEDWWIASRSIERGDAPQQQRLWSGAERLAGRRIRLYRHQLIGLVLLLLVIPVLLLTENRPSDDAVGPWLAGVSALLAVGLIARTPRRLRRLRRARSELQSRELVGSR